MIAASASPCLSESLSSLSDDELLSVSPRLAAELRGRGYVLGWHRPVRYAGVVYVLVNPAFPSLVKIGYADDVERRMRSLNRNEYTQAQGKESPCKKPCPLSF